MDVLVVLGTTSAWLYGVIMMFIGHESPDVTEHELMQMTHDVSDPTEHYKKMSIMMHTHNFEMSATLITVITFGKLLEAISKKQTVDKLS